MEKKSLKDYTPEQLWKLERRLMVQDIKRNPELQQRFFKFIVYCVDARKAHTDALAYIKASEEHDLEDFYKWCAENPLSVHAQLYLPMIERKRAAPAVEHGKKFTKRKRGSKSRKTLYIEKLVVDNPTLKAKELYNLADQKILGSMPFNTFTNKVTAANKIKK